MTDPFDIAPRVFTGSFNESRRPLTTPQPDLGPLVQEMWPDLPLPADVIILPREDYQIRTQLLAGCPLLTTRPALGLRVGAPVQRSSWRLTALRIARLLAAELVLMAWIMAWAFALGKGWMG